MGTIVVIDVYATARRAADGADEPRRSAGS